MWGTISLASFLSLSPSLIELAHTCVAFVTGLYYGADVDDDGCFSPSLPSCSAWPPWPSLWPWPSPSWSIDPLSIDQPL